PIGPDGRIEMHGVVKPLAARGKCRWFPYEVSELDGRVLVNGDQILVDRLSGQHDGADVQVDAKIDCRGRWSDVAVDLAASHVGLDSDLFAALSDRDKALWRRFNPQGAATLNVRLRRPQADRGDSPPAWQTHVTADLEDAKL